MTLLENEQFLAELTKLFQKSRNSGSVTVTMKRWDGHTKPKPKSSDSASAQQTHHPVTHQDYKCLFRATLGSKKISTVVHPKDVNKFQLAYANLMKANIDNLKKRDRKSDKDKKPAAAARASKSDM